MTDRLHNVRSWSWLTSYVPGKTQADVCCGGAYTRLQHALPLADCFLPLMQPTNHRTFHLGVKRKIVEGSASVVLHFMILVKTFLGTRHN